MFEWEVWLLAKQGTKKSIVGLSTKLHMNPPAFIDILSVVSIRHNYGSIDFGENNLLTLVAYESDNILGI